MLAHTCNPQIQEVEAVESEIHAHSLLQSEFETSMGYQEILTKKKITKYS